MVMTSQLKPRVSARGFALAGAVALMAYVASPLWACPPEEKRASKVRPDARLPSYKVLVAPKPPTPPEPPAARSRPAAPAPAEGVTTFERFMRDRNPDRDDMSLEDRIRELEQEIEMLYRQLQQLPRRSGSGVSGGGGIGYAVPTATLPELAPFAAIVAGAGGIVGVPTVDDDNCLRGAATMGGETVVRSYKLNEGKIEALGALMLRSDVPIRVRMTNDQIEVHASPAQHCIFELFCKLIDGEDRVEAHVLPVDKLAALTELMVRSDVPILVEPGREQIKVHGTDVEQAVFDAFCRLIHPTNNAVTVRSATRSYEIAAGRAQQYEAYATAQVATMQALRSQLRSMESQLRTLERQADRRADRADVLADKADNYADQVDAIFDDAEDRGLVRSHSVLAKAETLRNKANECQRQADACEAEAEALQDRAERIEDIIEQLEDQIEEIEDAAENEDD